MICLMYSRKEEKMQIKRLYNVFAILLSEIMNRTNERDFEKMRNMDERHEIAVLDGLKEKFPELFDKETRNVAEVSEFRLTNGTLIRDLEMETEQFDSTEEMIFLARCLDSFLEDTFYSCIPADEDWYRFRGLNDNAGECGLYLLPRIRCSWEHKSRDAYTSYSIFYYLRNFYFVCESELNDYTAWHILMPRKIFSSALERRELRVAVSPGIHQAVVKVTEPYIRENSHYVSVEPIENLKEKAILQTVLTVLKKAAEEETDILLFPEMLGTNVILDSLKDELYVREMLPNNEFPKLVACPTVWARKRNSCTMLDDMGTFIFEQCKHYGVDVKHPMAKEDIETDRIIYILHCFGIGRIAVAICKDFLMTGYLRILAEKLRVNLLLVPSFTSVDYQFEILSSKYPELDWTVIWVNACASRWMNEDGKMSARATMAYTAGKRGINTKKVSAGDLCSEQGLCDSGCIFIHRIRFDKEVGA